MNTHRSCALRAAVLLAALALARGAHATPSTVFCTPATTETQAAGVPHLTHDTHFAERGALQIDTGLTVGVPTLTRLQLEVGFDLYHPTLSSRGQVGTFDYAQLNARLTLPEHALASWMPGLSAGVSNVGFKRDVSNYHLAYAAVGKRTRFGAFALGMYRGLGSRRLWLGDGEDNQTDGGVMLSWVAPDLRIGARGLDRIVFMADAASGRNWFASSGVAIGLWFTPAIALKTGPVFFANADYYRGLGVGWWVWSVQLDVDVDLRALAPAAPEGARAPAGDATVPP